MTVNELKTHLLQSLFSASGKFCHGRLAKLSIDISELIFAHTPKCEAPSIKDRIYWIVNDIDDYKNCKKCGQKIVKEIRNFSSKVMFEEYCDTKCRMSHSEFHDKIQKDRIERTGYAFPLQDPEIYAKMARTNLERYGSVNVFQNEEIKNKIKAQSIVDHGIAFPSSTIDAKEKRRQTVLQRYGVENVAKVKEFQQRKRDSNLVKYGVENVNQVEEIKAKTRATNLQRYGEEYPAHTEKFISTSYQRYGVRHPMQHPMIFERVMRARFKIKKFVTKTGKTLDYQGYEDVMLKFLIDVMQIPEDLIVTSRILIPKIFYRKPNALLSSRYYPDIWIKGTRILIEVKSEFTIKQNLDITLKKQRGCKKRGYQCIIVVCDKRNILEFFI